MGQTQITEALLTTDSKDSNLSSDGEKRAVLNKMRNGKERRMLGKLGRKWKSGRSEVLSKEYWDEVWLTLVQKSWLFNESGGMGLNILTWEGWNRNRRLDFSLRGSRDPSCCRMCLCQRRGSGLFFYFFIPVSNKVVTDSFSLPGFT